MPNEELNLSRDSKSRNHNSVEEELNFAYTLESENKKYYIQGYMNPLKQLIVLKAENCLTLST